MNFSYPQIVFQEVPNHISLAFSISGCQLACKGCHSTETWDPNFGSELSKDIFISWIERYTGMISCVLFYGGEWAPEKLSQLLNIAQNLQLKTALYTGLTLDEVPSELLKNLTFIKTGRFVKTLGGITSLSTNQRFLDLERNQDITHVFNPNHRTGNIPMLTS